MKKALAMTVGLLLVCGMAFASNTGFKLNYQLVHTATTSNNNWISPPYFFFPNGNVGATPQNAQDWCVDINGAPKDQSKVISIARFETTADAPQTKSCGIAAAVFDLKPGEGYSVVPSGPGITLAIVGSHDDGYSANKGGSSTYALAWTATTSNNNWVSVPYHSIANNAQDLCVELNGAPKDQSKVISIARFETAADAPQTKSCGIAASVFDLKPGEGYSMVPAGGPQNIQFDVY